MDVEGYVRSVSQKVEACTQQDVELHVTQVILNANFNCYFFVQYIYKILGLKQKIIRFAIF